MHVASIFRGFKAFEQMNIKIKITVFILKCPITVFVWLTHKKILLLWAPSVQVNENILDNQYWLWVLEPEDSCDSVMDEDIFYAHPHLTRLLCPLHSASCIISQAELLWSLKP